MYHHGGIYLDSDVEVTKKFDELLSDRAFIGFIAKPGMIEAETIGCEAGHEMFGKLLQYYDKRDFILEDGSYDMKILPEIFYETFLKEGMTENKVDQNVSGVHIYPPGYFLMSDDLFYLSYDEGTKYLKETYSLHYGAGSWSNVTNKFYLQLKKLYLDHFWFVVKVVRIPVVFKLWQVGINAYRKMFWGT